MSIQDHESPPRQSHQMLNLPANKTFYESYNTSPQELQWPHGATFQSPERNGPGVWAPPRPASQIFNQQADPILSPPNILLWGQNLAASLPSTEWPQQRNALSEGDLQNISTVGDLIPQQPFAIQYPPGCFGSLDSARSPQDSCSNQDMLYPGSNPVTYAAGGFSYDTLYRGDILSEAQDSGTFFQPPSQKDFYSGISENQDNTALSQSLCQKDQNSSVPSLSFGRPSTETSPTSFDTSSNQSGISPAIYEPPVFAGRPQFSAPLNSLDFVAAAFKETLEAIPEEGLAKWPVNELGWNSVSVPTSK